MTHKITTMALLLASGCLLARAETVLFQDDFDTDSSANWNVFDGSESGTSDYTVDWAFDYSNTSYTSNSVSFKIPPAPNSGGTTKGVKLTVNKNDDVADAAAVNIYPKDKTFSGNYAVRFDMWLNYNGGEYGGTGSTEFAIFGIDHTGNEVNWAPATALLPQSDGIWYAVTGDAGAARDYRSYEGDPTGTSLEFTGSSGGFLDRDGNGTAEQEVIDVDTDGPDFPLNLLFPRPPFETTGMPSKRWVQVEVRQQDGVITWLIDGYVIAEKTAQVWTQTEGDIMLGTMDIFASVANPKADNFVIFDDLRVVDLTTNTPLPRLTLEATQGFAAEPSTPGEFTITRTGDMSAALNVSLLVGGTAKNGQDYQTLPIATNIPAGAASVVIPVQVIDDAFAEPDETVRLSLVANPAQYEVFAPMEGIVEIADDGDVTSVSVSASDPWAYEKIPSDTGTFKLSRVGDLSVDLPVSISLSGSAQAGTDYQAITGPAVIPAGEESVLLTVVPVDNSAIDTNRTVTLAISAGTGYVIGTQSNATVTIRNDDIPAGTLVFSDNFDTDTSADWIFNEANPDSNTATFNFDYSTVGIPPAPNTTNGTTRGLRLQANNGASGVFTGLSVSPKDQGFTGDYRLSFDMWINYPGPLETGGTGSTLSFSAGVGTTGTAPQFPGTSVEGVLFSVTGDGGTTADWRAYSAIGSTLSAATGVYAAGTQSSAQSNSDPYYSVFGHVTAPDAQVAINSAQSGVSPLGAPGEAWHEVHITKVGTNITWTVDNLRIATIPLTNKEISTNIFVGFFDINAGQTADFDMNFGLVDNLRVEQLSTVTPPGEVRITGITQSGQNLQITFTTNGSATTPVIEASDNVDGPYTTESAAQVQVTGGQGTATIPMTTAAHRFFRVKQ